MLILQDCVNKLAEFKRTFGSKFGIQKLGIFGSVARKENTENSDIDIVVEIKEPTLSLMYELKETLKALFGCEVDLVRFRETLRPLFKANILKDVIYVWSSYFHTRPWHAIYSLRNIISHEYANIDEEIIVSVINNDLTPLKQVIEELLKRY